MILRGALDGMAAVPPYGDRALTGLRGGLVPPAVGQPDGMLDLGGFYGLHPSLASLHAMYAANEVLIVHAVAGPYRSRSHFEAQDYLESGADHRMTSGWLNRAVAAMPPDPASDGERRSGAGHRHRRSAAAARTDDGGKLGAARLRHAQRPTCTRRSRRCMRATR